MFLQRQGILNLRELHSNLPTGTRSRHIWEKIILTQSALNLRKVNPNLLTCMNSNYISKLFITTNKVMIGNRAISNALQKIYLGIIFEQYIKKEDTEKVTSRSKFCSKIRIRKAVTNSWKKKERFPITRAFSGEKLWIKRKRIFHFLKINLLTKWTKL